MIHTSSGRTAGYYRGQIMATNSKAGYLPSILKTHFQEKAVVPAGSSPVILVMLEMR